MRFITTFSDQHQTVHSILSKHWHILLADPTLSKYLGPHPEITYRRSRSIKDCLLHSHYHKSWDRQDESLGLFRCGSCDFCHLLLEGPSFTLPNGRTHFLRHHITCLTKGVIYIILCRCGAFYIGKTIMPLWKRVKDHVYYTTNGILNKAIGYHVAFEHNYDPHTFEIAVLDCIYDDPRGRVAYVHCVLQLAPPLPFTRPQDCGFYCGFYWGFWDVSFGANFDFCLVSTPLLLVPELTISASAF